MKRFWDRAEVVAEAAGFAVRLDGKPLRLPGGAALVVESPALAAALAAEWQAAGGARGGEMGYADVPLTRLAGTLMERVAPDPAPVAAALAAYGESDLLCYRADAPEVLVRRQRERWQPWLDWAARELDAPLRVATGVMPLAQPAASLAALRARLARHSAPALTALGVAVPALGSLVLGLALAAGRIGAAEAAEAALLDELFQAELWGEDAAAAARRAELRAEVALAARFLALAEGALAEGGLAEGGPARAG